MSIEAPADPALAVLYAAAACPDATPATNEAHTAFVDPRSSEGLRRGWEEARVEAAVREAVALSIIEDACAGVDGMRVLPMADEGGAVSDPGTAFTLGVQCSQWNLALRFLTFNTRSRGVARVAPTLLPALIVGLYRDACPGLVAAGLIEPRSVAVSADPSLLIPALVYTCCDTPGPAVVAALTAHLRFRRVFDSASSVVGDGLAHWALVTRGVDPAGVCVPSAYNALGPTRAGRELAGWVSADETGLARWIIHYCAGIIYGAQVGCDVARHMQAGRLSQGYFLAAQEHISRRANGDAGGKRHRGLRGHRNPARQDAHRGRECGDQPAFVLRHFVWAAVRVDHAGVVDKMQERRA